MRQGQLTFGSPTSYFLNLQLFNIPVVGRATFVLTLCSIMFWLYPFSPGCCSQYPLCLLMSGASYPRDLELLSGAPWGDWLPLSPACLWFFSFFFLCLLFSFLDPMGFFADFLIPFGRLPQRGYGSARQTSRASLNPFTLQLTTCYGSQFHSGITLLETNPALV